MPQLNVVLVPAPDQVVVRVTGEADLSTSHLVSDALAQAAGLGTRQVVVDVAAARFWDCSGLHVLTAFTAELAAAGRSCRIVGAPASTRRLIELADAADQLNLDGAVHQRPAPNVAASLPFSAPTGRTRRPVPAHGAPAGGRGAAAVGGPVARSRA
jgi:anti-anti-sigma factor